MQRDLLSKELTLLTERIDLINKAANATQDLAEKNKLLSESMKLEGEASGVRRQILGQGSDPNSFAQSWLDAFTRIRNGWGTVATNISDVGKSAFGALNKGISTTLDNAIWKTGSAQEVMLGFAHTISQSVTQALTNMFMQWIIGDTAKSNVVKTNAVGEAAAKAPSALLTSIASFGIAAAIGGALFLATMALTGGFREQGGPVQAGKSYIVGERRPEVFVPSVDGVIIPNVSDYQIPTPAQGRVPMYSGGSPASSAAGGSTPEVAWHVMLFNDEKAAQKFWDSAGARKKFSRLNFEQGLEV